MNVLFLSLLDFNTFDERNIYSDLLREFIKNGHKICCVSPVEKRFNQKTQLLEFGESCILKLRIGNTQKVNLIEKGISTLRIEPLFIRGVKKYFSHIKFDLILYATPPVTFAKVIRYVKKRDGAQSYLMLKDIFPQNSIDLGMLTKTGIKGVIYNYFRKKEKELYSISDRIGCMSQANVDYILKHNPELVAEKVEICPNCIEVRNEILTEEERLLMRDKYGVPRDKKVFVYGGNLGKPQDVPFIVKCLRACSDLTNAYFVIAGSGTDRHILEEYLKKENPSHVRLFEQMPKDEYDAFIGCCDVGLIFLDHRFTIPNFPSRLLSYMQAGLPVLACTDPNTDVGKVIVDGEFGWWCESDDEKVFFDYIRKIIVSNSAKYSYDAHLRTYNSYDVERVYTTCFMPFLEGIYNEKQKDFNYKPQSFEPSK